MTRKCTRLCRCSAYLLYYSVLKDLVLASLRLKMIKYANAVFVSRGQRLKIAQAINQLYSSLIEACDLSLP